MAGAEKPVLQSAKLDPEADYADDIYARREEERIALAAAPIALEADGSFHYHHHDDGTPIGECCSGHKELPHSDHVCKNCFSISSSLPISTI